MFKANVTVPLPVLINNVNISRLNRIGRQLQPVELAAGELAVNWQTTSAWSEGLTLETSAFESLYGGNFTLSPQWIKPNYPI